MFGPCEGAGRFSVTDFISAPGAGAALRCDAELITITQVVDRSRSENMTNKHFRGRGGRFVRWAMTVAVGGSAFQLSGCDPAVRETLLGGLETTTTSLTGALISAFFLSLGDEDATGSGSGLTTT
jgi:hypothetical protein